MRLQKFSRRRKILGQPTSFCPETKLDIERRPSRKVRCCWAVPCLDWWACHELMTLIVINYYYFDIVLLPGAKCTKLFLRRHLPCFHRAKHLTSNWHLKCAQEKRSRILMITDHEVSQVMNHHLAFEWNIFLLPFSKNKCKNLLLKRARCFNVHLSTLSIATQIKYLKVVALYLPSLIFNLFK